ncbi:MAG: type II secretion system protein [Candidatus Amesbacteria bacterium]|nr:type II secretion system protein [Candidatus Amesbacteria bacterium]
MRKGFSLVELLVALSIMALIMGASLTAFEASKKSARDGKRKADLESIRSALEIYRSDNGGYPLTKNPLSPDFISTWPADPISTQSYVYTPATCTTTCKTYTLCATIEIGSTGACSYVTKNP